MFGFASPHHSDCRQRQLTFHSKQTFAVNARLALIALLIFTPALAAAQTTSDAVSSSGDISAGANELGVGGGGSFASSMLIGKTERVRLGIVGLRYARRIAEGESLKLSYTVDAIPAAVLSYPFAGFVQTSSGAFVLKSGRRSVYGVGATPIGFQLNFRRRECIQPFANVGGGFLYFADAIPNELGKQFNFTAEFGGGVQLLNRQGRAFTVGYKYHHISNGNRGVVNPGFDSNLFYAGFSIFK